MIMVAIPVALLGAVAFAVATVLQGRAVSGACQGRRLDWHTWIRAVLRPSWSAGIACSIVGAASGIVALTLAPVSIVQPIGVIAVPVAVVLTSRQSGQRPGRRAWSCTVLCMAGVALFITLSAREGFASTHVSAGAVPTLAVVTLLVAVLAACGHLGPARSRCAANSAAAAVCFGAMSIGVKLTATALATGGLIALSHAHTAAATLAVLASLGVGVWLTQHAYAAGSAAIVLACLTVMDPLVAVVLGRLLLGEGGRLHGDAAVLMIIGAAAAVTGVVGLARFHPAVRQRHPGTPPTVTAQSDRHLERTHAC